MALINYDRSYNWINQDSGCVLEQDYSLLVTRFELYTLDSTGKSYQSGMNSAIDLTKYCEGYNFGVEMPVNFSYGAYANPTSYTRGKYSISGTMTLTSSGLAYLSSITKTGSLIDIGQFKIIVNKDKYTQVNNGGEGKAIIESTRETWVHEYTGCFFTSDPSQAGQDDTNSSVEVNLAIAQVVKPYLGTRL